MAALAGLRSRTRSIKGFWRGVIAFWLVFGVLYIFFRGAVNEDTKISQVTLGEIGELILLIVLWPLEVLGLDIQLNV